jgi:serine protease Do
LRANGRVIRGRIGVQIAPVTKEVAEAIGLGKPSGALVQGVEAGGPAEKAGVEAGDIITKVDGRVVDKSGDLPRIIGGTKPGQKSTLQVFRRGSYKDLSVTVVEFEPDTPRRVGERSDSKAPTAVGALGLSVADLSDAQKRELKLRNGVRVEAAEGAAARAGLREGDVLLSLDNTEISSARQFEAVVSKLDKSKPANVLIRRGDWVTYLVIRPAGR